MQSRFDRVLRSGHTFGLITSCLGTLAWIEWYWVLNFGKDAGGPLPHLAYAPMLLLLLLGCVLSIMAVMIAATGIGVSVRIAYCLMPITYLTFQIYRLI